MDRVANEGMLIIYRRRLGVEACIEVADRKKKEWRKKIEEMAQERLVRRVFEDRRGVW